MKLCVNADDFGYTPEINAGILEAVSAGGVTSCSVMTRRGHHQALAGLEGSGVSVGLHFDLTSPARDRLSFRRPESIFAASVTGRLAQSRIEEELARQFDELQSVWRGPITHLDSHRHIHAIPAVRKAFRSLAAERGVGHIRCPRERGAGVSLKNRLLGAAFAFERTRVEFVGTSLMGSSFTAEGINARLVELKERGVSEVELMVHPGRFSPTLEDADWYNAPREGELAVLKQLPGLLPAGVTLVAMDALG